MGRSRECDLRIEDPAASRRHFRLERRGEALHVTDLGSSNGTYRSGRRLQEEERLEDGDVLLVGETEMTIRVHGVQSVEAAGGPSATVRIPTLAATSTSKAETPSRGVPVARPSVTEAVELPPSAPAAEPPAESPSSEPPPEPPPPPTAPSSTPEEGPAAPASLLPEIDSVVLQPESGAPPAPETPRPATRTGARPEFPPPAGFWVRLAAVVVDAILISLVSFLVSLPFGGSSEIVVFTLLSWILSVAVPVVGWVKWGATPGKRLFGLVLCSTDGDVGLAWGQAAIRWVGYLLSGFLLGAGFLMIAFSASKRGLHDHLAGTYVGKTRG